MSGDVDVLMITYNRPAHTRMALTHLLDNIDEQTRLWLWHNGDHEETLEIVRTAAKHPLVHLFHHSRENVKLRPPTNWLLAEGRGTFVSKVDDDCLVPKGWLDTLREIHTAVPNSGVLGCWRFLDEDFVPELAQRKIQELAPGRSILRNPWVEGSGFLMKRSCVEQAGILRESQSFTQYCVRLARDGWVNGWAYPFLWQEHLDDPRAPHSLIRNNEDLQRFGPLSAKQFGARSFAEWDAQLRRSAYNLQTCPWEAKHYVGWRRMLRRLRKQALDLFSINTLSGNKLF